MQTSQNGINLIKKFEGVRLVAYRAHKSEENLTIGYGHYSANIKPGQVITQAQAEVYLKQDLKRFEDAVNELKLPINQNMFDALISFCYNVGENALKKSTLLKKIQAKDYIGASNEFVKWNKAGGEVLAGLTRRRLAEKDLFLKGSAKTTVKPPVKKPVVTPKTTHVVVKGETLSRISIKNKITIEQIKKLNPGIDINVITPGQKIRLK
jgi:GH24 family phage-related lysozyme (muramidase)